MKNIICRVGRRLLVAVLGVSLACSAGTAAAAGDVVNIFFAGGQSNAVPHRWGEGVKDGLAASGKFGDFRFVATQHSGESIWNWIGFTRDSLGNPVFQRNVVPTGNTSGNTGANYAEDFFAGDGTGALEQQVNQVKANGDIPRVGIFWFQGEADTGASGNPLWEGSFEAMLQFIQEDVGQSVPVSFGLTIIDNNRNPTTISAQQQANVDALRLVQAAIGERYESGVAFDSRPYERLDAWHLTATESTRFGFDLATAFANNTPEPASVCLLGAGGLLFLLRVR